MDDFTQLAQDSSAFFSAMAQVSGGLVGLVFVALTFNPRTLGAEGDPMLKTLAQQTFADFVMLLLISLVMLVPHTSAANIGITIVAFCAGDMVRVVRNLVRLRRHLRAPGNNWSITQRFVLSALGRGLLILMGVLLVRGGVSLDSVGSALFSGIIVLLISGCRSAWLLVAGTRPQ